MHAQSKFGNVCKNMYILTIVIQKLNIILGTFLQILCIQQKASKFGYRGNYIKHMFHKTGQLQLAS